VEALEEGEGGVLDELQGIQGFDMFSDGDEEEVEEEAEEEDDFYGMDWTMPNMTTSDF
jgi:hypothetical protein